MHRVIAAVTAAFVFPSVAQANPYCAADLTDDFSLDFADASLFLAYFASGDPRIDFDGSGSIDFGDVSSYIAIYAACPDLTDTDGDRVPDFAETDNGVFVDMMTTGTDPLNSDTDGDGLDDGVEINGTPEGLVLPGADPVRRDIYVECDWYAGVFQGRTENYRPTPAVEARVVAAFAGSGVENPYGGAPGVNIHLDYGQGNGHTGGNQLPGQPVFVVFDSEFNQLKADHFDPRRKGYYHYAVFANRYNSSTNGSSGFAEIFGDDFMVTMVNFNSTNNMANTIMHELGHNLGLRHGGDVNRNYKPNYNSVMNYRHQFPGVDTDGDSLGNGALDYSHGTNITLNETALLEVFGVNGFTAIDWNGNGLLDPNPIARNLNCGFGSEPCGSDGGGNCYDSGCSTYDDWDDWGSIFWNRLRLGGDRRPVEMVECDNWPGKH